MVRFGFTPALLLLASALACALPDTMGNTEAASTGTGTTTSATDPTTLTGTASTSSSTATTTTTGTTDDPSTSHAHTTGTDTTVATAGPMTSGSGTTTDDTGGGAGLCEVADGDYGPCEALIGWAFDGTECTLRSGCSCGPDCDLFFDEASACALACAGAGHCNEDRVSGKGIIMGPVAQGDFCDGVYLCPTDPSLEQTFTELFPMFSCEGMEAYPCEQGTTCAGLFQGELGPDEWLKVCAASLVQGSGDLFCVVFGP